MLLAAIVTAYVLGAQNYLSLSMIAQHLADLKQFVSQNRLTALLIYIAIYIAVVALSLPGAALLSLGGAVVLGWQLSVPASIVGATIGAVIVFQIVKTSLGSSIAERAGPFVQKLAHGFQRDAFNYLLFLRLTPLVPFFAVNAVAGLVRVDLRTFTLATVIGIIPGSLAFAWLGSGLDDVLQKSVADFEACMAAQAQGCALQVSALSLFSPQLVAGLSVLGVIALIPVLLRLWKQRS